MLACLPAKGHLLLYLVHPLRAAWHSTPFPGACKFRCHRALPRHACMLQSDITDSLCRCTAGGGTASWPAAASRAAGALPPCACQRTASWVSPGRSCLHSCGYTPHDDASSWRLPTSWAHGATTCPALGPTPQQAAWGPTTGTTSQWSSARTPPSPSCACCPACCCCSAGTGLNIDCTCSLRSMPD